MYNRKIDIIDTKTCSYNIIVSQIVATTRVVVT